MTLIETKEYRGRTIELRYDEYPESPRDWDDCTHLLLRHERYSFPWECDESFDDYADLNDVIKGVKRRHDAKHVFLVYGYEHGGIILSATDEGNPFRCSFDSGLVGIAYVTNKTVETMREYFDETWDERAWARDVVDEELKTYTSYVNGCVYGCVIRETDENSGDACWGYYSTEDAYHDAESLIDYDLDHAATDHVGAEA